MTEHWETQWAIFGSSLLLLFGIGRAYYYWRKIGRCTRSASALVLKQEAVPCSEGGIQYRHWLRFKFAGKTYELSDPIFSATPSPSTGESVKVYFAPQEPQQALVGRWRMFVQSLLVSVIGAIFLAVLLWK